VDVEVLASLEYDDTPIAGTVSFHEELVTWEGQLLNPLGDVTLGYVVSLETSTGWPAQVPPY